MVCKCEKLQEWAREDFLAYGDSAGFDHVGTCGDKQLLRLACCRLGGIRVFTIWLVLAIAVVVFVFWFLCVLFKSSGEST